MPMKVSSYFRPKNLDEAIDLLKNPDAAPLAGGTKLLADNASPVVVDLQDLGLDQIKLESGSYLIGSMTRLAALSDYLTRSIENESGAEGALEGQGQLLIEAIQRAGPNTYRNAATAGGIVASRLPDSELIAALLVMETVLRFYRYGRESIPLEEYLSDDPRPAGLIVELSIPQAAGSGGIERVARTPADYPIVSVTYFRPEGGDPRLAATGINLRPIRLREAEKVLVSGGSSEEAAAAAKSMSSHPGDFRGDARYRAEMVSVLTRRVLEET